MSERSFNIAPQDVELIKQHFGQNLPQALHSPAIRRYIARTRWLRSGKPVNVLDQRDEGVTGAAVKHNRKQIDDESFASSERTARLINPLSGLSPVFENAGNLKILSIGPRTEMELLHLLAIGFRSENIFAVDLISTSPFIDLGDAHALPYETSSFDVVICGWVINYSRKPELVLSEIIRVAKPGALLAIGATHSHEPDVTHISEANKDDLVLGVSFGNSSELLARMPTHASFEIHLVQEPRHSDARRLLLIVRLSSKSSQS